jgi:hypothetical protein
MKVPPWKSSDIRLSQLTSHFYYFSGWALDPEINILRFVYLNEGAWAEGRLILDVEAGRNQTVFELHHNEDEMSMIRKPKTYQSIISEDSVSTLSLNEICMPPRRLGTSGCYNRKGTVILQALPAKISSCWSDAAVGFRTWCGASVKTTSLPYCVLALTLSMASQNST